MDIAHFYFEFEVNLIKIRIKKHVGNEINDRHWLKFIYRISYRFFMYVVTCFDFQVNNNSDPKKQVLKECQKKRKQQPPSSSVCECTRALFSLYDLFRPSHFNRACCLGTLHMTHCVSILLLLKSPYQSSNQKSVCVCDQKQQKKTARACTRTTETKKNMVAAIKRQNLSLEYCVPTTG